MFKKRRKSPKPVRLPETLFVARYADTQDLLAYSPPRVGGIYYVGCTEESLARTYWAERMDASEFVIGGIETLDLVEIVANEADGLAVDPGTESYDVLSADDLRAWVKQPHVEIASE